MDTQQVSAPSRAPSRVPGRVSAFGVIHVNSMHTSRFTIVGNHLAQHGELSLTAIGLAVHIQSLPDGAKVGIKALADRFPESEARIAAALRELENHNYLERTLLRLPGGKLVTRTISYNQPDVTAPAAAPEPHTEPARPAPAPATPPPPAAEPPATAPTSAPAPEHASPPAAAPEPHPEPHPEPARPAQATPPSPAAEPPEPPAPAPEHAPPATPVAGPTPAPAPEHAPPATPVAGPTPAPAPVPPPPTRPRPPLPQPHTPDLERHRTATDLLAGLRHHDPRLLLGEHDVRRLAPAVAAWLERDAHPDAVRHALTAGLPEPLKQPAGLLAHRLTTHLPPPPPAAPTPTGPPHPLQNCDECDRAFRAPEPGRCRDCTTNLAEAA